MVILWHIWDAINKCGEGEGIMHPKFVAAKIKAYINNICIHLYKPVPAEHTSSTSKCVPPLTVSLLVNMDAATCATTRQMGVGVVVHDHTEHSLMLVVSTLVK
jgi:hypothetical protein